MVYLSPPGTPSSILSPTVLLFYHPRPTVLQIFSSSCVTEDLTPTSRCLLPPNILSTPQNLLVSTAMASNVNRPVRACCSGSKCLNPKLALAPGDNCSRCGELIHTICAAILNVEVDRFFICYSRLREIETPNSVGATVEPVSLTAPSSNAAVPAATSLRKNNQPSHAVETSIEVQFPVDYQTAYGVG